MRCPTCGEETFAQKLLVNANAMNAAPEQKLIVTNNAGAANPVAIVTFAKY